jgi:ribosomal protein S18 acetylase RimI-like enzyme
MVVADNGLRIDVPLAGEQADALRFLCRGNETQFLAMRDASGKGRENLELFAARRGPRRVGVAGAVILPGRTAQVCCPRLLAGEVESTLRTLLFALDSRLAQRRVQLAQCVLASDHVAEAKRMLQAGYVDQTRLLYLACGASEFPASRPQTPFSLVPYQEGCEGQLAQVMRGVYAESRDFSMLNGKRDMESVIQGYRTPGQYRPDWWFFVQHGGRKVGCLLMNEHRDAQTLELVYFGLEPAVRGRAWGRMLMQQALWLAGLQGARQMVLGVDRDNQPALRIYEALGFITVCERAVLFKFFDNQ